MKFSIPYLICNGHDLQICQSIRDGLATDGEFPPHILNLEVKDNKLYFEDYQHNPDSGAWDPVMVEIHQGY